jgi:hypothetical protein
LFDLEVTNGWTWKHRGMDSTTAQQLRGKTLYAARWQNDRAVHDLWQPSYMRPFMRDLTMPRSIKLEKALERLAYLVKDLGESEQSAATCRGLLSELNEFDVWTGSAETGARA